MRWYYEKLKFVEKYLAVLEQQKIFGEDNEQRVNRYVQEIANDTKN